MKEYLEQFHTYLTKHAHVSLSHEFVCRDKKVTLPYFINVKDEVTRINGVFENKYIKFIANDYPLTKEITDLNTMNTKYYIRMLNFVKSKEQYENEVAKQRRATQQLYDKLDRNITTYNNDIKTIIKGVLSYDMVKEEKPTFVIKDEDHTIEQLKHKRKKQSGGYTENPVLKHSLLRSVLKYKNGRVRVSRQKLLKALNIRSSNKFTTLQLMKLYMKQLKS